MTGAATFGETFNGLKSPGNPLVGIEVRNKLSFPDGVVASRCESRIAGMGEFTSRLGRGFGDRQKQKGDPEQNKPSPNYHNEPDFSDKRDCSMAGRIPPVSIFVIKGREHWMSILLVEGTDCHVFPVRNLCVGITAQTICSSK
jgi:hypothetical protein